MTKKELSLYLRNFTFGVEDSLVSTVGLLSGITVAGVTRHDIFVTGVILIVVEALSMASGSFLSEHASEEAEDGRKEPPIKKPILGAMVMFVSYIVSGLIPLFPYIVFETSQAFIISIIASLLGLTLLGIINAKAIKRGVFKHAMEMLIVGGVSIMAGVIVGKIIGR